ncbi:DUF257 domain-containing protein [Thermococcus aggregans]|uniref:DUF257 domain-containing protein n=1 Tax=Thermococcus aggregans TaxID=110163 RepID=A0A9E7SMS5_THEAG|nr:DUF257 family protein [Thermococcus aggregans]USS39910.1 DUF257 domain-containing protein [Thermococcus aggregans]
MSEFEDILKPKTAILLEYKSTHNPGPILFRMLEDIKKNYDGNLEILLTDFLDMLSIYKYQAELSGVTTSIIKEIPVIKVGGKLKIGNVIRKIPISSYAVHRSLYGETVSAFLRNTSPDAEFILNIQVGLEYLLNLFEKRELVEQIHDLGEYIVTKTRDIRDVIFLNIDALKDLPVEALSLLSIIMPVIAEIKSENTLTIKKSPWEGLINKEISLV